MGEQWNIGIVHLIEYKVMYRYIIEEWGSVMKNMLIVYYSWSNGNTERIAKRLSEVTGADIEKLETVIPYKGTYREVVDQGKREVDEGYMPEIKELSHDINVSLLVLPHGGIQWLRR